AGDARELPASPTRRSSDLWGQADASVGVDYRPRLETVKRLPYDPQALGHLYAPHHQPRPDIAFLEDGHVEVVLLVTGVRLRLARSEEHTSELQSRERLVCR